MSESREVEDRGTFSAQGIGFRFAGEQLQGPTDWSFSENHHVIVVHRAGVLSRLSSEFSGGVSSDVLPQSGDCWIVPAGSSYAAEAVGDSVEYCELHVPVGTVSGRIQAEAGVQQPFLFHAVEQLATIAPRQDDLAGLLRENVVHGIRLYLKSGRAEQRSGPSGDEAGLALLENYLRDSLSQRHSLDDMAHFSGVAPSTLLRQFRKNFGKTPYRWLLEERVNRSKELLQASNAPITEIALDVGFSTPSHFSEQFRKIVGYTPREYRAAMKS